jgi:uncharacterized protein
MEIIQHNTAASFLERAGAWLERAEAENNLVLGIAPLLRDDLGVLKIAPYYITIEEVGEIIGVAFMHPPRHLILTHMPNEVVIRLAGYLLNNATPVSGVNGPKTETELFAEYWATRRGKRQRLKMSLGINVCEEVIAAARSPGRLRATAKDDEPLLVHWAGELARDAGIADESAFTKAQIPNLIAKGRLYVWENGEIVSMAGLARETRHGFAVALVYTPPQFRKRGYASSCVAALTQCALDSGRKFCCLYTDLANPTSNSIYQKIGYQPICEVQDWVFE